MNKNKIFGYGLLTLPLVALFGTTYYVGGWICVFWVLGGIALSIILALCVVKGLDLIDS